MHLHINPFTTYYLFNISVYGKSIKNFIFTFGSFFILGRFVEPSQCVTGFIILEDLLSGIMLGET